MAVLDGHHNAGDPTDPVGSALGKIVRSLPEPVATQAEAVRRTAAPAPDRAAARPDPATTRYWCRRAPTTASCGSATAPRPARSGSATSSRGRWSSATAAGTWCAGSPPATPGARTGSTGYVTRKSSTHLRATGRPRPGRPLEEHLAVGWEYTTELVIDGPIDGGAVRVAGARPAGAARRSDNPPDRHDQQPLLVCRATRPLPAAYRIVGGPELRATARKLAERMLTAATEP